MRKFAHSTILLFMFQCLLTMLLAFPFAHAAVKTKNVTQRVNAYVYQGDSLDVLKELKLKAALQNGDKLISLKIVAQAAQAKSGLKVLVNGEQTHKERLTDALSTIVVDIQKNQVDEVLIKGKALYIKKITATVDEYVAPPIPPRGGGTNAQGVIKAHIQKNLVRGDILKVRQTLKQETGNNLRGLKVKKIVLKGHTTSRRGRAALQLLINGVPSGQMQRADQYSNKIVFLLPNHAQNVVGQDIKSIQVQVVRGAMMVQVLKVKTTPQIGPGPGDYGRQNQLHVNVGESFYGRQRVSVANLIAQNHRARVNMNTAVKSITLQISGRGVVKLKSAYEELGTMVPTPYGRSQTVRVYGYKKIQDLMLKTSGRVTIESMTIELESRGRNNGRYGRH